MTDPYEVLGVARSAPDSVIKAAYRARIRETHPDSGGDPGDAQAVNEAFAILSDPDRRAKVREPRHEPQAPEPATQDEPARTPEPAVTEPSPVYSTHARPGAWWRSKLVWVPAVAFLAVAAACVGWLVTYAVVAVAVSVRWTRNTLIAGLVLAALPALTVLAELASTDGDLGRAVAADPMPLVTSALPVAAYGVTLALWAVARRRRVAAMLAHLGDTFLTTRDTFGLTPYVVADITATSGGLHLVHLDAVEGPGEWPLLTARHDGATAVGDLVLVHRGHIIASATAEMLRAARR
jgi:hypothetical protein